MNLWNQLFGNILPTVSYCEAIKDSLIARPAYFLSNIPYIILGVYLVTRKNKISKILGMFSILIGIASSVYDASYRYNAQLIDLAVMCLFISFLFIKNLSLVLKRLKSTKILFYYVINLLSISLIYYFKGGAGSLIFAALITLYIISELMVWRKFSITKKYWIIALTLFLIGWIFWQFDAKQIVCSPIALLNGRALFHYFTAGSIFFLYKHLK